MGEEKWTFDPASTDWIILEIGGLREHSGGESSLRSGKIRANLSTDRERQLYVDFKKHWLKGYKTVVQNAPRFGPSAAKTLVHHLD